MTDDIFTIPKEAENLKRIGFNSSLAGIPYGQGKDEVVFIGRWWFASDIQKMMDVLKNKSKGGWTDINEYITVNGKEPVKPLNFTKAELGMTDPV